MRIRIYQTTVFIRSRPVERCLFLFDNFFVLLQELLEALSGDWLEGVELLVACGVVEVSVVEGERVGNEE